MDSGQAGVRAVWGSLGDEGSKSQSFQEEWVAAGGTG